MPRPRPAMLATLTLMTVLDAGCSETPDERLTELTRESMRQQASQNEHLARQAESVGQQSQRIAEAAQALVEQDAEARRKMIAAHSGLQHELQTERASIDRQKETMEEERKQLAGQRNRDPIIAQTIAVVGTMLACLLPLLLAGYILYTVNRNAGNDDDHQLAELFIDELAANKPLFLPSGTGRLAIEHDPPADDRSVITADK